jgi:hypothetical protein
LKITIDIDDRIATTLNRWISKEAANLGPPYLKASEVIAAAIVTWRYTDITDVLRSQIRHQRGSRPGSAAEVEASRSWSDCPYPGMIRKHGN